MKSKEAIFLGYGIDTKGYRLFDCVKRKVYFSRDVQFDEGKFFKCRDDIELDKDMDLFTDRIVVDEEKDLQLVNNGDVENIDNVQRVS